MRLDHSFRVVDVGTTLPPDEHGGGDAIAPDRLQRECHEAGIVRAIVAPPTGRTHDGYLAANNAVARRSVERPFVPFARLTGVRDASRAPTSRLRNLAARRKDWHTAPEDVEQYAYGGRFEGFVLDPARDGLPDGEVLAALGSVGFPVRVRAGRDFPPARAAETLLGRGFPVVLASFGGWPLSREHLRAAIDRLGEHERLYLDTAAVRYRDPLERALREHPDRVLFASGAPAVHPSVGVVELLTLDVTEDLLERALDKNPSRVVGALAP